MLNGQSPNADCREGNRGSEVGESDRKFRERGRRVSPVQTTAVEASIASERVTIELEAPEAGRKLKIFDD